MPCYCCYASSCAQQAYCSTDCIITVLCTISSALNNASIECVVLMQPDGSMFGTAEWLVNFLAAPWICLSLEVLHAA